MQQQCYNIFSYFPYFSKKIKCEDTNKIANKAPIYVNKYFIEYFCIKYAYTETKKNATTFAKDIILVIFAD